LYVLTIATGCELNIKGEVKTCPDPALPVGALAGETTVGVEEAPLLTELHVPRFLLALTPSAFRARMCGEKLVEYQEFTEKVPLLPEAPEMVAKPLLSYEYSQLVMAEPPSEVIEKEIVPTLAPVHVIEP
jgi:hypothetical protein